MQAPILSLSHATLVYEHGIRALDDVTLDIAEGERVCVLGANGSGKSTLASVLCGLLAPDEGSVTLVDERVFDAGAIDFDAYRRARRRLGLVFQNPDDQIVTSVVEEDVALGPENLSIPSERIGERVARELHRVGLDRYAQADPAHLSGGQKQRVCIAGALAMEPDVLVLDEPGALLDVRGRRSIMGVMDKLRDAGTTIVHVTHFMDEALAADRVLVLDKGRLVLQGSPSEVFAHAEELGALGLEEPFAARLAQALREQGLTVRWTCDKEELTEDLLGLLEASDAKPSPSAARHPAHPETSTNDTSVPHGEKTRTATDTHIIAAEDLCYSYGDSDAREARHPALDKVSFAIDDGTYTAIVGQTGSGKSTLLRLLCALETPDAGRLEVDGIDTADKRHRHLLYGHVGYVMQHPERQLFAETVLEDVAYGPTNLGLPADEVSSRCRRALALVGLTGRESASPFHLSGGQQRLCALAGILAMEPRILVLDEPMAGLDPRGRSQLRSIIADVSARGVTVVQVTHSMDDAASCEQVIVLNEGTVLLKGAPHEVFSAANEQILHDNGLGLPEALRTSIALARRGIGLGETLTMDQLVHALASRIAISSKEVRHGL